MYGKKCERIMRDEVTMLGRGILWRDLHVKVKKFIIQPTKDNGKILFYLF